MFALYRDINLGMWDWRCECMSEICLYVPALRAHSYVLYIYIYIYIYTHTCLYLCMHVS